MMMLSMGALERLLSQPDLSEGHNGGSNEPQPPSIEHQSQSGFLQQFILSAAAVASNPRLAGADQHHPYRQQLWTSLLPAATSVPSMSASNLTELLKLSPAATPPLDMAQLSAAVGVPAPICFRSEEKNGECSGALSALSSSVKSPLDQWCLTQQNVPRKICFTWTIESFSLSTCAPGETLSSDVFAVRQEDSAQWCLQVAPYGKSSEQRNFVSICVVNLNPSTDKIPARFRCSVLNTFGMPTATSDTVRYHALGPRMSLGFGRFLDRSVLYGISKSSSSNVSDAALSLATGAGNRPPQDCLVGPNDRVTFFAEVYWMERCENQTGQCTSHLTNPPSYSLSRRQPINVLASEQWTTESADLSDDLGQFLERGKLTDLELVVAEGSYSVSTHKAILAACSTVLAKTFLLAPYLTRYQLPQLTQEAAHDLLHYMYTRRVPPGIKLSAVLLLSVADQLDIARLKAICERELGSQLQADNVCRLLMLAHDNQALWLEMRAIDWITRQPASVVSSPDYQSLIRDRPQLLSQLFRCLATAVAGPSPHSSAPFPLPTVQLVPDNKQRSCAVAVVADKDLELTGAGIVVHSSPCVLTANH